MFTIFKKQIQLTNTDLEDRAKVFNEDTRTSHRAKAYIIKVRKLIADNQLKAA